MLSFRLFLVAAALSVAPHTAQAAQPWQPGCRGSTRHSKVHFAEGGTFDRIYRPGTH